MINYLKSEHYRLLHKRGLYITSFICLFLITAAALLLYYFGETEPNFPFSTSKFFYSNVVSSGLLIIIVGLIFNLALTGKKDLSQLKQSVSFGISRNVIFWSKLIVTLSYFLLICIVGIIFMIVLGENLLESGNHSVSSYLVACVNMAPLVLSGFFLTHTLKMLKVGDAYIIIVLLLIYSFSSDLLRLLFRPFAGLDELYKYAPSTLLSDNLMNFVENDVIQFDYKFWVVGIVISLIALLIGARKFSTKNID